MEKQGKNHDIFISWIRKEYGIKDTNSQEITNNIWNYIFLWTFLIFALFFFIIIEKSK